jgi:hypothetical protein
MCGIPTTDMVGNGNIMTTQKIWDIAEAICPDHDSAERRSMELRTAKYWKHACS